LKFLGYNPGFPLDVCEGDCDRDSDCKSGLKCFRRIIGNRPVPGCTGDKHAFKGLDFCYQPPIPAPVPVPPPAPVVSGTLKIVGNIGGPGFPLGICEGDCDWDSDCQSGLKCFQRDGLEPVPYCTGDKRTYKGSDFCYKPRVLKFIGNNGGSGFPLGVCEGDCDRDSDCQDGLKCFQRHLLKPVPGCTGDSIVFIGMDFCYQPNT
jgi:hypothetical protein